MLVRPKSLLTCTFSLLPCLRLLRCPYILYLFEYLNLCIRSLHCFLAKKISSRVKLNTAAGSRHYHSIYHHLVSSSCHLPRPTFSPRTLKSREHRHSLQQQNRTGYFLLHSTSHISLLFSIKQFDDIGWSKNVLSKEVWHKTLVAHKAESFIITSLLWLNCAY